MSQDEGPVDTFALITTSANEFMSAAHNRMPIVLEPESVEHWLDPRPAAAGLAALLTPPPTVC